MSYQCFSMSSGAALALAICACGAAPLNPAKLVEAQGAVHAAETLGAEKDPRAKQMLQLAREQTTKAKRLADQGDGEEATYYLERATADAELASQIMRTQTAREKAREAWAKSQAAEGDTGASR